MIEAAGSTEIEVLHPPLHGVGGSDNANSIVLRVTFAGRSILLPGDLESPGLENLLETPPGNYDVVMAPHHGSPRSRPRVFAEWSHPVWVVISGGHSSETANVRREFEAAGARVRHTDQDGAVRVRIAANRFSVEKWRRHARPFAVPSDRHTHRVWETDSRQPGSRLRLPVELPLLRPIEHTE